MASRIRQHLRREELVADDRIPVGIDPGRVEFEPRAVGIRFIFGAVIAVIAGLVGMVFGQKAGGLFLAFPAILPATLTLIEEKEDTTKAYLDMSGGVVGAIAMAGFAATAWLLIGRLAAPLALLIALLVWLVAAVGLYALVRVSGLYKLQDRFGPA